MSLTHACPRCGYDHSSHITFTTSSETGGVEPKAQKCPVCEGNGKVDCTAEATEYNKICTAVMENEKQCHGCDGKGWVTT